MEDITLKINLGIELCHLPGQLSIFADQVPPLLSPSMHFVVGQKDPELSRVQVECYKSCEGVLQGLSPVIHRDRSLFCPQAK